MIPHGAATVCAVQPQPQRLYLYYRAMADSLTRKQARFIDEYLVDRNGAQAAIRAGYSARCARETAYKLLTNGHISSIIDQRSKDEARRLGYTRERILAELQSTIDLANDTGDSRALIWAWSEIARLLDLYPAGQRRAGRRRQYRC